MHILAANSIKDDDITEISVKSSSKTIILSNNKYVIIARYHVSGFASNLLLVNRKLTLGWTVHDESSGNYTNFNIPVSSYPLLFYRALKDNILIERRHEEQKSVPCDVYLITLLFSLLFIKKIRPNKSTYHALIKTKYLLDYYNLESYSELIQEKSITLINFRAKVHLESARKKIEAHLLYSYKKDTKRKPDYAQSLMSFLSRYDSGVQFFMNRTNGPQLTIKLSNRINSIGRHVYVDIGMNGYVKPEIERTVGYRENYLILFALLRFKEKVDKFIEEKSIDTQCVNYKNEEIDIKPVRNRVAVGNVYISDIFTLYDMENYGNIRGFSLAISLLDIEVNSTPFSSIELVIYFIGEVYNMYRRIKMSWPKNKKHIALHFAKKIINKKIKVIYKDLESANENKSYYCIMEVNPHKS